MIFIDFTIFNKKHWVFPALERARIIKLGKTCRFCEIFDFGKVFYTKNIVIHWFSNVFECLFGCIRVPNGGLGTRALCLGYGWLNPGIIQAWINATTCCAARRSMVAVPVSLAPAHMFKGVLELSRVEH